MNLKASLTTGVAFDNFDRFVETLSGKDTPHDTVGIAYQLSTEETENSDKNTEFPEKTSQEEIPELDVEVTPVNESQSLTDENHLECIISKNSQSRKDTGKRRRRAYEAKGTDIAPYRKKPKMECTEFLPLKDPRRKQIPDSLAEAKKKDIIWMMSHHTYPTRTPLWLGRDSKHFQESKPMQKIWYLSPINESPTSDAVVAETLATAQKVAEECGKRTISVNYDLAIAKKAMQIQSSEEPKYNNVFVNLDEFHIKLAFF